MEMSVGEECIVILERIGLLIGFEFRIVSWPTSLRVQW